MREINECTAEVFRRSEKRIKERKRNRNRILTLCIPLCLIVTVWSVMILPAMLPASESNDNAAMGESIGGVNDTDGAENAGLVHSFILVDVKGTGSQSLYHSTITDAPDINDVFEQIYTILIPHESHNDIVGDYSDGSVGKPDGDDLDEVKDATNNIKASGYIITMTTLKGVNRTFTLTENKLYDSELNIEINLTDEQMCGLKSALGLPD